MTQLEKIMTVFVLVIVIGYLTLGPFLMIWSLNTLFGTQIVISLKTWAAALFLIVTFSSKNAPKKS